MKKFLIISSLILAMTALPVSAKKQNVLLEQHKKGSVENNDHINRAPLHLPIDAV